MSFVLVALVPLGVGLFTVGMEGIERTVVGTGAITGLGTLGD